MNKRLIMSESGLVYFIFGTIFYLLAWVQLTITSFITKRLEKMKSEFIKVDNRVKKNLEELYREKNKEDENNKEGNK